MGAGVEAGACLTESGRRGVVQDPPQHGPPMSEARYTDEEVSLILREAMEADEARRDAGLTLAQLKEIAAEVGVDPAAVESAALAVRARRHARMAGEGGAWRTTTRYETAVRGRVAPEHHAALIRAIRAALGRKGVATEEFGALEWRARDAFGGRYITIRPDDDGVRVEALGNFRDGAFVTAAAGGTLGLAGSALILKATLGGLAFAGILAPLGLAAGAALPALWAYRRWFRREDEALRRAVAEVAAAVEALPAEGSAHANPQAGRLEGAAAEDPGRAPPDPE